jgi:hypothetical protein
MRLYTFGNYYLSSIQQGIQAAHLVADMFVNYQHPKSAGPDSALYEWADQHKTMVCLSGGNHADLTELYMALRPMGAEIGLPVGIFYEDGISLNRAATVVGIVVPARVYEFAAELNRDSTINYTDRGLTTTENQLAEIIRLRPLAR